jgi:ribosomal protein S18 acetylase RimI-like enzyme
MNIEDFLPKYPNIKKAEEELLNPYDDGFYESIFKKREFYEERTQLKEGVAEIEKIPDQKGLLMKHQKIIARFLSSHTMYDALLLVHEMGTGKTCSAIGAIEQIKNEDNNFKGAMVFAKGQGLLQNFVKELRDKCTAGQYVPEGFTADVGGCGETKKKGGLTELETTIRTKKLIQDFYSTGTFETFAKHLSRTKDADIITLYSNHIIVIDEVHNLRIQDVTEGDRISMYTQFKRFLHLIKNCKILLLSGTPMKDTPEEIASVMNLILPEDLQLPTGEKFVVKYLDQHGENSFTVKKNKINALKKRFKGRISFIKAIRSTVTKEFVGDKNVGKLKHLIVEPVQMSKFQTKAYTEAVRLDERGKAGVHYNARQASLMVFPDGSYGQPRLPGSNNLDRSKGFEKYVKTKTSSKTFTVSKLLGKGKKNVSKSFSLTNELTDAIKGDTKKYVIKGMKTTSSRYQKIIQARLKNLRTYSAKYANVIESILNANGESCFVYSELVTGSGSIVFSELLKLFGFSPATGKEGNKPALRYGFLTSEATSTQIHKIINCFNQPDNMHGDIIKVLIGSKVVSEGVSFYNVQREYILTPWYNYSETDQAIARGHRLGSHKGLLNTGEEPIVRISQLVAMPRKDKVFSIDLYMYEISEDKDITIRGILRYMMEAAFDCSLNYYRNHISGEDGTRGCDYQECDYVCDGINMKNIEDGLPIEEIDDSTYQLYYADPKVLSIRKDLEKYFRQHNELELDDILRYFEGKYTEWEINNALRTIIDKSGDNLYYRDYVQIYSRANVKKIMVGISKLFSNHFRVNFTNIVELFPTYTTFEVLTALKNMIDESVVIKNKYGFSSYLREDQNIYFLVNSLMIQHDSFSDYYARVPNIVTYKTFLEILYDVQIENLPMFIKIICKITKPDTFAKLIRTVPDEVQELFIEAAVEAQEKKVAENQITRKLVLDYFLNYIHQIKDVWVSNRLSDEEILRCYENGKWDDCGDEYDDLVQEKIETRKGTLEQNPWGYYGQYNPETGVFSMVNIIAQKEKQAKLKEKETKKLADKVKNGKITQEEMDEELETFIAGREIYPGRNCRQGWGVPILMKIAVRTLKLEYPDSFKKNDSEPKMRKLVKNDRYLGKGNKKEKPIYTTKEIDELSKDDLRRALYWSTRRQGGYIEDLCKAMEEWFRNTKWEGLDMLIPDRQAGTSGGHKKIVSKPTVKKQDLRIEKVIPERNEEKFKTYLKEIQKLMNECFAVKKYVPDIDDKIWVMVFSRKKLVGFLAIDNNNVIWNVCVGTNYRRRGIAQQAIQTAVKDICPDKNPRLLVDNRGKNYKKLVKLYNGYGFTLVKNDGKVTTMEFKCS